MKINFSDPLITNDEIEMVNQILKNSWVKGGEAVKAFEQCFKDYLGVKYAIAVNNGTSGLHLLIKALGIKEGDEVITTPFSFVASTNCILFERGKPVFVDIDANTFNIDVSKIEDKITEKTKAILPVDVFGQPLDMPEIRRIAQKHDLKVIEDSCEAIGSEYKGIKTGTLGDGAVFSFYLNKQITTGEGGMIVTNDENIAKLCSCLRSQGRPMNESWLLHETLGYNYRLSDMQAALGISQMNRIEKIIQSRQLVADLYRKKLSNIEGVTQPFVHEDVTKMSWFIYVILLDEDVNRNMVLEYLLAEGIECKPYFMPIHLQPYIVEQFKTKAEDFPVASSVGRRSLALPFNLRITEEEIDIVVKKLAAAIAKVKECGANHHE